jgi:Protein of unknown function (DUF2829)
MKGGVYMDFSEALLKLKNGSKVTRNGWNGKGQFIYFVPESTYPAQTEIAKATFGKNVPYGAYLAIRTVQNNVVPWLASQTDLLANDWEVAL